MNWNIPIQWRKNLHLKQSISNINVQMCLSDKQNEVKQYWKKLINISDSNYI